MPANYSLDTWRLQAVLAEWGPRILGAILILAIAWALGKAAQWALAKLIDRTPGLQRHNAELAGNQTVGRQLGQLANWLILLIGLLAALGVLGLDYIVEPLSGLVANVLDFLPRLVGAALIFFIGFVVATLAKRVVTSALDAAHVDRALEKAGVKRLTGASGLARTAGTIVFVLILIPITIAALEQLGIRAISEPAVSVLQTVLDALPRVLAAAVVLAIAYLIARWVASLIEQILPSLGFDRSVGALGLFPARASTSDTARLTPSDLTAEAPSLPSQDDSLSLSDPNAPPAVARPLTPSRVLGQVALWGIMLFAATEAARLLEFGAVAVMLQQVLELAGRVLFGGVIILLGVLLANLLAQMTARAGGEGQGFASTLVRWATIALATAMGLRFMGIADEIVILAFGLILGSAAIAAAIAFGIGGRDPAKRLLEQALQRAESRTSSPPPDSPRVG